MKKIIIILISIIFLLGCTKEEKIEIDKEKVISNLKANGYEEAEKDVYVINSDTSNGLIAYIFDFNNTKMQVYYNNDSYNVITEYNYSTNKASYLFVRDQDRGTISYDKKTNVINCESNILNWCDKKEEIKKEYIDDLINEFNSIIK